MALEMLLVIVWRKPCCCLDCNARIHIKDDPVSLAADLLWKQAGGKDKEGSEAAFSGEDLSEEDAVGAHFASTGLLHRLCRACHPSKKSHSNAYVFKLMASVTFIDLSLSVNLTGAGVRVDYFRSFLKNFALTAKLQDVDWENKALMDHIIWIHAWSFSHYLTSSLSKCGCMMRMWDWTAVMWHSCLGFTRFLMRSLVSKRLS